jgi:hypothetical protein
MLTSIQKFLRVSLIAAFLGFDAGLMHSSQAQPSRKFSCEALDGAPTTIVKTVRGSIPMIRWVKAFTGRYSNVERRCREVSDRLDRFDRDRKLKFIRTGNVNTYPVICVDSGVSGNTCATTKVLVTLPKGTDSSQILQQMLDLRARASGNVINLGGEQLVRYRNGDAYVSVERLLGR